MLVIDIVSLDLAGVWSKSIDECGPMGIRDVAGAVEVEVRVFSGDISAPVPSPEAIFEDSGC